MEFSIYDRINSDIYTTSTCKSSKRHNGTVRYSYDISVYYDVVRSNKTMSESHQDNYDKKSIDFHDVIVYIGNANSNLFEQFIYIFKTN